MVFSQPWSRLKMKNIPGSYGSFPSYVSTFRKYIARFFAILHGKQLHLFEQRRVLQVQTRLWNVIFCRIFQESFISKVKTCNDAKTRLFSRVALLYVRRSPKRFMAMGNGLLHPRNARVQAVLRRQTAASSFTPP
jgi:hypothetical protein